MANNSIFNEGAEGLLVSAFCAKACEANSGSIPTRDAELNITSELGM